MTAPRRRAADAAPADAPHDSTLLFAIMRLVNLTARPFQEGIGRRHRLGLSEWRVLAVLAAHPGIAASEVAQRTGLDKMSVSRALGSLEQAGRVARRPDPDDGRRALAAPTPAGRRLYDQLRVLARRREADVLDVLSPAERAQLAGLVRRMTDALLATDAPEGRVQR